MPDGTPALDRRAIELLWSIIETPKATISGMALDEYHGSIAPALKGCGLLKQNGYDLATVCLADHDDEPVHLSWSADHGSYGYFSPTSGWITVADERLASFRIDFEGVFDRLLELIERPPRFEPVPLVPELLWEVGDVRLPGRARRAPLWIGRRLHDTAVWDQLIETTRTRPAPGLRVVLSLTAAERLPKERVRSHSVIAVRDVVDHSRGLAVNPELLAARVAGYTGSGSEPITVAADGAVVTVHGRSYRFRGSKQRAIVRQLHEALLAGAPHCLTAEVLEHAECSPKANTLAKAFSGRDDWRDFIKEQGGRCWMFH